MHLLLKFFRVYPWQSALMLFALLLAGIAEGISLSALLPLLSIALDQGAGAEAAGEGGGDNTGLEAIVRDALGTIGITPSIGVLLAVVVVGIVIKNLLLLLARKQIGYTAAQVTTDLRLA
ncbi:MAG: ABC transporter ATP-binding protein, partial [Gammaproteobacteria bacterium]